LEDQPSELAVDGHREGTRANALLHSFPGRPLP
jgi:hypothetical protein